MVSQCQTIKKLWAGHESAPTDVQTDGRTDRVIPIYPPELRTLEYKYIKNTFLFGLNKSCYYLSLEKDKFALNLPSGSEEEDFKRL